jgi:hypothetical protein
MAMTISAWKTKSAVALFKGCVFACLAFALVGTAVAESGSLRDERTKREQDKAFAEEAKYTSEVCGSRITASIHWQSFENRDVALDHSYYRDCDVALAAIERMCREGQMARVTTQIKSVQCGAGTKRRVVLSNGTLLYAIPVRPKNDHKFIYDYLNKKL